MEHFRSHWTDIYDTLHLSIFRKCADKIHVSLKSDKNNEYFIRIPINILDNNSLSTSNIEKYFRQIDRENKTYIVYSINFLLENRATCELTRKNIQGVPEGMCQTSGGCSLC
jgi:hypothetical protein